MEEKPVLVSVRVDPELYKEVKKIAIDRDDSVTAIVRRAFERYLEEGDLYRLSGNDRPDVDEESLFFDLKELEIEKLLDEAL